MTINDAANYQRKIYEFEIDVIRHIEMLAAAYMKKQTYHQKSVNWLSKCIQIN